MNDETTNPCQSCGACCAAYRVSFYWAEGEGLPEAMVHCGLLDDTAYAVQRLTGTRNAQSPAQGQSGNMTQLIFAFI